MDLSTNDARLALVAKWAAKYGLEPALVCAVCEQESGWNTWAMRYEPGFFQHYVAPALEAKKISPTEAAAEATSFGLMQVMGGVARELGFVGPFLTELCDPDVGIEYGCKKLQQCFATHDRDLENSLLAYNGGGNPNYGKQVLARVSKYTGEGN